MHHNPELNEIDTEIINQLTQFDRHYNFKETPDQATFAEGMRTLGVHCARNSGSARIDISVGSKGITEIRVSISP